MLTLKELESLHMVLTTPRLRSQMRPEELSAVGVVLAQMVATAEGSVLDAVVKATAAL